MSCPYPHLVWVHAYTQLVFWGHASRYDTYFAATMIGTCKWSCRFWPTGKSTKQSTPDCSRCSLGPTPESMSNWAEWTAPQLIIISRVAFMVRLQKKDYIMKWITNAHLIWLIEASTATAFFSILNKMRVAWELATMVRFLRPCAFTKYDCALLQRFPLLMFT